MLGDDKHHAIAATLRFHRRNIADALYHFGKALECGEDPLTHTADRWACHMLLGDFEQAWIESDLAGASFDPTESLASKDVLIRCLRGLGDAIQFLRYVPE